jgi:putative intracellular protease/amidase
LGEVAHFVDVLVPAGWEFDYVSPRGGYTPLDPVSLQMAPNDVDWKWYADAGFRKQLANTLTPADIKPENYDLIFYAGGHGVIWDFPENKELQAITTAIWEKGGIVSSVCHGVVGLLNVKLSNGDLLVKGRKITGFSNAE